MDSAFRPEHSDPPPALPSRERARGLSDGTLFSRYECKYVVEPSLVPHLRRFSSAFLRPDRFASRNPRHTYAISSLYLDSSDLELFRMNVEGRALRHKLRVRAYDDDPQSPVYFEIKRRIEGIVHKRRARVGRDLAARFLAAHAAGGRGSSAPVAAGAEEFVRLAGELRASPVVRVRYLREAYESAGGDPVRLTFDTQIEYAPGLDGDLSLRAGEWRSTRVPGVVLEVKFTDVYPSWIERMVSEFELQRESVAKYALSVQRALGAGLLDALIPRGFEATP